MIKYPALYLAIKRPKDEDYYVIATHKRRTHFRPLTCIDDLPVFKKKVIGFSDFTADNNSLKLYLDKLKEELSTEEMSLEGLVIFDFSLGVERAVEAEAYVFNSIIIKERKNTLQFSSESSYLRVNVEICGEKVKLISEPVKCSNYYDLLANVKLKNS